MSEEPSAQLPAKQLGMIIDPAGVRRLPDVSLPVGYAIRAYRQGDEAGWASALQSGGFTNWDVAKVLGFLDNAERREGSQLVEHGGEIVAATFASRASNRSPGESVAIGAGDPSKEGVVDYVVTHPRHQGRGLGRATCTEVSRFLIRRGCEVVALSTDDWRLPAIHIYLSMGYRPVLDREDMPGRWAQVFDKLKQGGREYP